MAKSTFNPTMQPNFTPMSDNPMSDPLDVFAKAAPAERVSSLRESFEQIEKTPTELFWEGGARKEGFGVNGDAFRNREIQLLRQRIQQGLAGANDLKGYEYMGSTVDQIKERANNKTPGFSLGMGANIGAMIAQGQLQTIENTELAARVDQYIAIVKMGDALDDESRQELMELYRSGARSADIAKKLKDAQEGKGIYGERVLNKEQAKLSEQRRVGDNRMGIL